MSNEELPGTCLGWAIVVLIGMVTYFGVLWLVEKFIDCIRRRRSH